MLVLQANDFSELDFNAIVQSKVVTQEDKLGFILRYLL